MQLKGKTVYITGKTVYITGGTGGIGVPLVGMLKEAGAFVTSYDRTTEGELVENLEKICARLQENTPDILINMAGYNVLDYCEYQDMKAIIDLNMMVPIQLIQAVLPTMKARDSGHIVNIGSMTALIPLPHLTGYVAAKSGLKGFNDALRRELGSTHIHVTHIAPRAVRTSMNAGVKAEVNARTKVNYDEPEVVAKRIMQAIIKTETDVRIGFPERLFALLNACVPLVIDKGLQKNCKIGETALRMEAERKRSVRKLAA